MGALLALASAACYGLVDFAGGLLSRRAGPAHVALAAQVGALVVTVSTALLLPSSAVSATDLAWGGLSGVGTGVGMVFLYRSMSQGDLSVVVPMSAVGGVVIPVVFSVLFLGDRPAIIAWAGMLLAAPALWFLLRTRQPPTTTMTATGPKVDALVASGGIAIQYLAIAQAGTGSPIWPIASGRATAVLAILPLAISGPPGHRLSARVRTAAVLNGCGAALALLLYLLATRQEMITISVVLASLYPVVPVVFGVAFLSEPLTTRRALGLTAALLAVGLLAAA